MELNKFLGLTVGVGCCFSASAQEQRPNILFIQVDQHRYDCTEMTSDQVKTPNIKVLASEGMMFHNAFTPIPTSCPARQCLLSGLWPEQHHGLWNYDITFKSPEFDAATWTEELSESGYTMGYVGKWHVHPKNGPKYYGFDDYVPEWGPYEGWRKKQGLPEQQSMDDGPYFGGYDPVDVESSKTHWMAGKAIELIKKYSEEGKPWHIRFDLAEPHLPCFPVAEYYDMYDADKIEKWGNFDDKFNNKPYIQEQQLYNWGVEEYTWDQWKHYVKRYFAMISQVDDAVGTILDALKEMGLEENTIVVYTADHGDAAGSHGMVDKHYVMYDEVVRVPLIIRWPGVIEPGSSNDNFVIHELDLAATMCDIADLDHKTQGKSLLPLLKEENPEWRQYAFSNYNGQQFGLYVQRMIRDNKMKYVWNLTDVDELYDLEKDPFEMNNLINKKSYKDELQRLRSALYADLKERKDPLVWQEAAKFQLLEGRSH